MNAEADYFAALPARPTATSTQPRPPMRVPTWLVNWREVLPPPRCTGIREVLRRYRQRGIPDTGPIEVRLINNRLTVSAAGWCQLRAAHRLGLAKVPVLLIEGDAAAIRRFESVWGGPRRPHPLVHPELVCYEGRRYRGGGCPPEEEIIPRFQRHPLPAWFPQAAAAAMFAPTLCCQLRTALLFQDGVAEHLAELLACAAPYNQCYRLGRDAATIRSEWTGTVFGVERWADLSVFTTVFAGADWLHAATGLAFTTNLRWGDAVRRLRELDRVGLDTVRVVIANPDRATGEPGYGALCHLVAQYVMAPSGLVSVLEEDRFALPDG